MKKQLVTSVDITHVCHNTGDYMELVALGEVFYMRRTRFMKRLVRKVIHKVEVPVDYFTSAEEAKAEARRQMDEFVKKYYATV
ncbi:hypothetical protein [uncultured Bacteroides sp.]|jgi:hypothetical protein|uniref:hypothetical protein n=1 Tax=uncultured Bacteroides sp. TaxID=162156 RepID=UPI000F51AEED|nr:hypothetical protein [uncultured Bacteroides sp.]ROS83537.1 hypothetical protein EEK90_07820 [Muribaculaceae bacterium Isolate-036 (Harlan)]